MSYYTTSGLLFACRYAVGDFNNGLHRATPRSRPTALAKLIDRKVARLESSVAKSTCR